MIGSIRKHSSWLWGLIIIAIIISFVIFFTPNVGSPGYGPRAGALGSIDGREITRDEYEMAQREAALAYFWATGSFPGADARRVGYDAEREIYQRLLLLRKIEQHDIHIDSTAVARAASDFLRQLGGGQPIPYATFEKEILLRQRLTTDDFERFLRHQLALQQLVAVVGAAGALVPPRYAEALYVRRNQEVATKAVFFSASNHLSEVAAPTPEALSLFYTNSSAEYLIPERIEVSYVSFPVSNYLADAEQQFTNLNELVESTFEQVSTNYTEYGDTPESAKARIRELYVLRPAIMLARRDAERFADKLFDMPPGIGSFLEHARTNGLEVKTTAPFDANTGPAEIEDGAAFAREAFSRTDEEPFGGPVITEDAVYIIARNRIVPGEVPPLDSIRERVEADYRRHEAAMLARRAGEAFSQTVSNGLAQGKTFEAIASEAGLSAVSVPPVSMVTTNLPPDIQEHVSLYQYQQLALQTEPGTATPFSPTGDGGLIVFVERRLPIDPAKMTAEMPTFLREVRQARRQDAVNSWFSREASHGLADTPLMRRQTQGLPAPAES